MSDQQQRQSVGEKASHQNDGRLLGFALLSVIFLQITFRQGLCGTMPLYFKICAIQLSSNSFVCTRQRSKVHPNAVLHYTTDRN